MITELSFSSDRCGPSKRGAEKIEGRTLRGGGVLKSKREREREMKRDDGLYSQISFTLLREDDSMR